LSSKHQPDNSAVVDLADARTRLRSRIGKASPKSLAKELEDIYLLLDKGQSIEARERLVPLITEARNDPFSLARARLALSLALEMHGDNQGSLRAIAMYESPDDRVDLPPDLGIKLRVQISLACNYTGDHPRAIAMLNCDLRALPSQENSADAAAIYAALARVYRSINEYAIARDYSQRALEIYRQSGDWRGLAEAYFGIAATNHMEGKHEAALNDFEQALKLIGNHPATFFMGKIYSNMASTCRWLKRPQDGIQYLEKAIGYYERSEHKALAADGLNNLANNLILTGQWERAHESLERALALAGEVDERANRIAMMLDSLGELCLLRGDLEEARDYLDRAVSLATENGNKWYACQALRTMARCQLALGETDEGLAAATQALDLAERIGDRQAVCESELLSAESYLASGKFDDCEGKLAKVADLTTDSAADMGLGGETQRLRGLIALARSDGSLAAQHFGRTVSIFELLGDRYRSGRAHFDLGRAYMLAQPTAAAEHLARAINIFRELGAKRDLASAETALNEHNQTLPQQERSREAVLQLITLRLAEAVASRALLLRELAAVLHQEIEAKQVLILEPDEEQRQRIVTSDGYEGDEAVTLVDEFISVNDDPEARARFVRKHEMTLTELRPSNALPATLLMVSKEGVRASLGTTIEPLIRVVELGLDVCALRARAATGPIAESESGSVSTGLMPGFIHSSPAMTRLVEEVHRIRSSDVTVLVTGESGTGKELVARAIHALSSRRQKVFVPFNCTAVPKELSESYLFGHRRGAFTGAISDSPGVIRTAEGGTLFIDEVGDLPLDVQPKLLRFLQEGEIQPLGERQPSKIDVRIIAATNTDLEELVAQGRFREDLYYRLNVIRLRVPPLRERRSEIPAIVSYYVNHYSAKFGRHDIQISPQSVDLLMVADWPGNVRQLCNEIQRVVARTENTALITPEDLSPELRRMGVPTLPPSQIPLTTALGTPGQTVSLNGGTLAATLEQIERRMVAEALQRHKGNITRAARDLGLTRRGLYLKIERYEIDLEPLTGRATG
jgi:DNA-binding NtrC family response regulator/tetratricopeptide (TPR) repeat protein